MMVWHSTTKLLLKSSDSVADPSQLTVSCDEEGTLTAAIVTVLVLETVIPNRTNLDS